MVRRVSFRIRVRRVSFFLLLFSWNLFSLFAVGHQRWRIFYNLSLFWCFILASESSERDNFAQSQIRGRNKAMFRSSAFEPEEPYARTLVEYNSAMDYFMKSKRCFFLCPYLRFVLSVNAIDRLRFVISQRLHVTRCL